MAKTPTPKKVNKPLKEEPSIKLETLPATLKRLEKMISGAASGQVIISPLKSKTLVTLQIPGSTAESVITQTIDGNEAALGFSFSFLTSILLNRDTANFKITDGQLFVKDKRYEAELPGEEIPTVVRVEKPTDPTCDIAVTPSIWAAMRDMTAKVKITRSLAAMPDITIHFNFTKKGAMAIAFDKYQLSAMSVKNTFGAEFSLTLPLTTAEVLFKNPLGAERLMASEAMLYVKSGTTSFNSSLPIVEEGSGVPVDVAVGHAKKLREMDFKKSVTLPKEGLKKFLDNSRALSSTNALLLVEVGDGKTKVTLSSDGNKVSATLPSQSKKTFQFKLDIGYVNTLVEKSGEEIRLEVDDSMLVFRTDLIVYSSVLSVDDDSSDDDSGEEDEPKPKKKKKNDDE